MPTVHTKKRAKEIEAPQLVYDFLIFIKNLAFRTFFINQRPQIDIRQLK
jgi:hypothetical protein